MVALLSLALLLSPRAVKALYTFSRRSRRAGALQERLDGGARQRHDRLAGHAALLGGGAGGCDKGLRQAVAIGLAQFHEPFLLVAEQMVAEGSPEMGQPLVDLGHPLLGRLVEPGAGAMEAGISPLQQAHLLGGQPKLARFSCNSATRPNSTAFIMIGFQCRAIRNDTSLSISKSAGLECAETRS